MCHIYLEYNIAITKSIASCLYITSNKVDHRISKAVNNPVNVYAIQYVYRYYQQQMLELSVE